MAVVGILSTGTPQSPTSRLVTCGIVLVRCHSEQWNSLSNVASPSKSIVILLLLFVWTRVRGDSRPIQHVVRAFTIGCHLSGSLNKKCFGGKYVKLNGATVLPSQATTGKLLPSQ